MAILTLQLTSSCQNGNFTLLLTSSGQEWNSTFPLLLGLTSSGHEW